MRVSDPEFAAAGWFCQHCALDRAEKPGLPALLSRYWHAARHQTPRQWRGRLRHEASRRLCSWLPQVGFPQAVGRWCDRRAGINATQPPGLRAGFAYPDAGPYPTGGYLGGGVFAFLGEKRDFSSGIDWDPAGAPLLWRFHLNYFDWAPGMAAEGRAGELRRQIESWIAANPPGRFPAWHPYPASLRVGNWIRALSLAREQLAAPAVLLSLARQAAFVAGNLEYHLGGNHLIENAFALLAAGLALEAPAAERWRLRGLTLLSQEFQDQILPDGGHFERSLSYHFRVNLICREAIALLRSNGLDVPGRWMGSDAQMEVFLQALRHPDGGIPLFHDAQQIEAVEWARYERLRPPEGFAP